MRQDAISEVIADNKSVLLQLIDEDNLQTRMLSSLVGKHFSLPCHILSLTDAEKCSCSVREYYLFIINCHQYSEHELKRLLQRLEIQKENIRIALINVKAHSYTEELISWPQVMGMFYNDSSSEQLLRGLQEVIDHGHWLPRHLISRILETQRHAPHIEAEVSNLTPRETQILQYLIGGLSNQEIGDFVFVSSHTVRSHLYNIYKKIGVKNRTQACSWAKEYLV